MRSIFGDGVDASRSVFRAAALLEEAKRKNEAKGVTLGGTPVFIARGGNGRGFTVTTISAAVAVKDGNRCARPGTRSSIVATTTPNLAAPKTVLSGAEIHSSALGKLSGQIRTQVPDILDTSRHTAVATL